MNAPAVLFISLVFSLAFCGQAFSACSPDQILRDDVLIVVNDNSIDSAQVGEHYCEQRGIDPANIVHVRVPATSDVQFDQFISLRDQIIRFMLENTLPAGIPSVSCDRAQGYSPYYCPESMDQIRQLTKIRYLVLTKGIPARFNFPKSTLKNNPEAVVDNYLRFWLLNYFDKDVRFTINTRAIDFEDGRGMRTVEPAIDHELIVGRIDGINARSAMNLVDRSISAEKNGVFGKLYSSNFGPLAQLSSDAGSYWKRWLPDGGTREIYPSWKYLHGLFGDLQTPNEFAVRHDLNPECLTYDIQGNSPQECVTRLTSGGTDRDTINDPPPGTPEKRGRIARADAALVYQGYSDGFSSVLSFSHLLNWRETDDCSALCAADDAACRGASVDVYQEIDTRCVRVADGFIGYNFNSYPVGMMAAWPTGWFQSLKNTGFRNTGSANYYMWPPEISGDSGFDDNYSLWYRNTNQKSTAACYTDDDDLQGAPSGSCAQDKRVNINQIVSFPDRAINLVQPQSIVIRFKYRGIDLNKLLSLKVRLFVREAVYEDQSISILSNNQIDYGRVTAALLNKPNAPADGVSWGEAVAMFTLDPGLHQHPQYLYDGIKIRIESDQTFDGQLAIDTVTVEEDGIDIPLQNASFNGGHQQVSGGDSAATFLSRLNGAAFWGNISHHESTGHSFDSHPYETLIYFMRGLPLGDAVWFAETHNSGILYGDPLYSPAAIHLHYLPSSDPLAPNDHFLITAAPLALWGDTLNGTSQDVTTTYNVDYCSGHDFFTCDQANSCLKIVNLQNKKGGIRNAPLGNWDISTLPEGDYTLRLSVASANASTAYSQTFYDYYPVTLFGLMSDHDADGLSYAEETSIGSNPWDDDTDADMLPDAWEVTNNLDALTQNTNSDTDGDGFSDFVEYSRQSKPNDPGSVPDVSTYLVDPDKGIDNGQSPFQTIDAAMAAAQAGDTIFLAPGSHVGSSILLTKPINLEGVPDYSAVISLTSILNEHSFDVLIKNLTVTSDRLELAGSGLNFEGIVFLGDTAVNSGVKVSYTNVIFSAATQSAIKVHSGATVVLNNATITNNVIGIHTSAGGDVQIKNSIITGNENADLIGVPLATVSYSLIGDPEYADGNGNIYADPLFVDWGKGDYHLQPGSAAIDAGDPASDYSLEPAGTATGRVNMGAYGNTAEATVGDTDDDGMPDDWEYLHGLNPLDGTDSTDDIDNDRMTNQREYSAGTDPDNKDTDSDGVEDGNDDLPLDPEESVDTDGDGIGNRLDEDDDNDGVMDILESAKDSIDARIVSGLPLLNGDTLAIVTASGETLTQVVSAEVKAIHDSSGTNLMFGMVSYTTSSEIGGSVAVRMTLSRPFPADLIVYKRNDVGGLYELPSSVWRRLDETTIEVTVTDGDPLTDDDKAVNGSIADPVIFGVAAPSSSGGGGGCTIDAEARMDPIWLLLLLAIYLRIFKSFHRTVLMRHCHTVPRDPRLQ